MGFCLECFERNIFGEGPRVVDFSGVAVLDWIRSPAESEIPDASSIPIVNINRRLKRIR